MKFLICFLVSLGMTAPSFSETAASSPLSLSIPLEQASLMVIKLPKTRLLFSSGEGDSVIIRGEVTSDVPTEQLDQATLRARMEEEVLIVEPSFPEGKEGRFVKRHCRFDLQITVPQTRDCRLQLGTGSVRVSGPFTANLVVKMRSGNIVYEQGEIPAHDFEGKAVFGKIVSNLDNVLPRPYFPLGKRIFILHPEGKGNVYIRTTFGKITVNP